MAKTNGVATWLRLACLLLSAMAGRVTMGADPGASSRYVTAPANPTSAPADPTLAPADPTFAPADPTFAPADPRESFEPRDMTSPRAVRRALRGRSRDRIAPDQPVAPPLRDLTDTPVVSGRPGLGRRFETLFRFTPDNIAPNNARVAPAEPAMVNRVAPAAPAAINRVAPSEPTIVNRVAPAEPAIANRVAPSEPAVVNRVAPAQPAVVHHIAPAEPATISPVAPSEPVVVSQTTPTIARSLPPEPAPIPLPPVPEEVIEEVVQAAPVISAIRLAQDNPNQAPQPLPPPIPLPPPAPLPVSTPLRVSTSLRVSTQLTTPPQNLAIDEQRVDTLNKPIGQIALIEPVDVEGLHPADISAELQPSQPPRLISGSYFVDAHPARYLYCFTHQPLYFEEANLERCGITYCCCQPVVSAAQFAGRTALLPYSLLDIPPCRCVRTLGDCPTCNAYPCWSDWNR
jgi:hypothetical protein